MSNSSSDGNEISGLAYTPLTSHPTITTNAPGQKRQKYIPMETDTPKIRHSSIKSIFTEQDKPWKSSFIISLFADISLSAHQKVSLYLDHINMPTSKRSLSVTELDTVNKYTTYNCQWDTLNETTFFEQYKRNDQTVLHSTPLICFPKNHKAHQMILGCSRIAALRRYNPMENVEIDFILHRVPSYEDQILINELASQNYDWSHDYTSAQLLRALHRLLKNKADDLALDPKPWMLITEEDELEYGKNIVKMFSIIFNLQKSEYELHWCIFKIARLTDFQFKQSVVYLARMTFPEELNIVMNKFRQCPAAMSNLLKSVEDDKQICFDELKTRMDRLTVYEFNNPP
uniref:Uncharacterized protein n=1 Tax=Panagrolaimus superbus TaxID=310955 RepID=A0A914YX00_9BILA